MGTDMDDAMYDMRANMLVPRASQNAAITESSIRLCPVLFRFLKGIGDPLRAQPTAQDTRNTNQATLITTTVTCLTKSSRSSSTPQTPAGLI